MTMSALSNITVVELAQGIAGPYCGRMLSAHGARVIKIEPPNTGDNARYLLPRINNEAPDPADKTATDPNASGLFGWLNANKESIALDKANPSDLATIENICAEAQVVILDTIDESESNLTMETLQEANPHLILCNVTFFGQTGPYKHYLGNDALCTALSGLAFGIGEAGGSPTLPSGYGPQVIAGVTAAISVMTALLGKQESTNGYSIDLSVLEATIILNETGAIARSYELDSIPQRFGVNRFPPTFPMGVFRCADGWVGITALTPGQWIALCDLLEVPELGHDPDYYASIDRFIKSDELDPILSKGMLKWSARELVIAGQGRRVPLALVPTPEELLTLPEFVERGALSTISLPGGKEFQAPDIPFILKRTPARASGPAPDLDQHRDKILKMLAESSPADITHEGSAEALKSASQKPLEGIRVIDLSKGWSGPLAARFCADMGADVIKVEDCRYPDWWRGWEATRQWVDEKEYEKMPSFNSMNRNKLGITLDLTTDRGRDLVKKLVKDADAVIENYTSTVLPKLGLDYSELKKVNPNIVMISMPAWGMSSAWSDHRAYGSTVEQGSGLPHLNGRESWPPTHQHVALGDAVSGLNAAVAVLIALYHQKQTGEGQLIDLSQVECLLPLGAHGMIEYSLNHANWPRLGSHHPEFSPWGVYPCEGEEAWLAITCSTDDEWANLANAINRPELAGDDRFDNHSHRKRNEDALDELISAWTIKRSTDTAMTDLQNCGVPAAVVRSTQNLVDDLQLQERGYFEWAPGVHRDVALYPLPAFTMDGHRQNVQWPAPTLGEHNEKVLREKLALTDDDIESLAREKIIGTVPIIPGETSMEKEA